jgi:hypothetical protein
LRAACWRLTRACLNFRPRRRPPVTAAKALPPPTEDQVKIILYEMLVGSDQIPRNRD